ncbi:MAG: class I SAM-dependent methyltransferase [Algisphaera sp.]
MTRPPLHATPDVAPDIASSTDDYATRFAGPVGAYLLDRQTACVRRAVAPLNAQTLLDVGGGHAQLINPMKSLGLDVTVLGSDLSCRQRPDQIAGPENYTFVTGPLTPLPFPDQSFDVVLAFRMLAHVADPQALIAELCRVARQAVVVDHATPLSFNALAPMLFKAKKKVEGNTRPYQMQSTAEIKKALNAAQWHKASSRGQFFWPMAIHRKLGRPALSRLAEAPATLLGLRQAFGSPRVTTAHPDQGPA